MHVSKHIDLLSKSLIGALPSILSLHTVRVSLLLHIIRNTMAITTVYVQVDSSGLLGLSSRQNLFLKIGVEAWCGANLPDDLEELKIV